MNAYQSGFRLFLIHIFLSGISTRNGNEIHFRKLCTNSSPSTSGSSEVLLQLKPDSVLLPSPNQKPGVPITHAAWQSAGLHLLSSLQPSLLLIHFFIDMHLTSPPSHPPSTRFICVLKPHPFHHTGHINSPCGTESAGKPEITHRRRQRKKFTYNFWGL